MRCSAGIDCADPADHCPAAAVAVVRNPVDGSHAAALCQEHLACYDAAFLACMGFPAPMSARTLAPQGASS